MIESSLFWTMLFAAALVYWMLRIRWRMWFLALVSLAYLAIASPRDVKIHSYTHAAILLGLTLLSYVFGPLAAAPRDKNQKARPRWLRRLIMWSLLSLILGYLLFTKYVLPATWFHGVELKNYAVPLGISYISFRLMHMVVDSARNPEKFRSLDSYIANVFFFTTTAAGPIERYEHFLANRKSAFDPSDVLNGITRIIYGLIKRFVIAEALFADSWRFVMRGALIEQLPHTTALDLWAIAIAVFLYLYLDFSAYTDIAVGCCLLFGIRVMENFNWPIIAPNIASFWKRWHMTLTDWCQRYVYMPLVGLTRKINTSLFVTFLVIGLWHGTSKATIPWVLWGAYNGVGMIAYQYWARLKRLYKWAWCDHWLWYGAGVVVTLLFISLGTFIALAEPDTFTQARQILVQMSFLGKVHA